MAQNQLSARLESLDVLRGFDLFCLVALEAVMHALDRAVDAPWMDKLMWVFTHKDWDGFTPWDLVMPLFMFMSGVTIPFALSRYRNGEGGMSVYWRIVKRVIVLWVFGMLCQGNLLALDPNRIYLYSNTLQAIALGYLVASILYLTLGRKAQLLVCVGLLLLYWAGMEWCCVDGYGGGNYTATGNFAEWLDRVCLGRFRDGAVVTDGVVNFAPWNTYTWVWSSLTFGVTTMTGVFAGYLLKDKAIAPSRKFLLLVLGGAVMVVLGWIWGIEYPVIKRLWTGSMVLVSSGYCWMLMGAFFYVVDYKRYKVRVGWLKVYGMNSIAAYMLASCVNFSCIGRSLFFGFEQFLGAYYPVLIAMSNAVLIYVILYLMFRRGVFLKV